MGDVTSESAASKVVPPVTPQRQDILQTTAEKTPTPGKQTQKKISEVTSIKENWSELVLNAERLQRLAQLQSGIELDESDEEAIRILAAGKMSPSEFAKNVQEGKISRAAVDWLLLSSQTHLMVLGVKVATEINLAEILYRLMASLTDYSKMVMDSALEASLVQAQLKIKLVKEIAEKMMEAADKKRSAAYASAVGEALGTFAGALAGLGTKWASILSAFAGVGQMLGKMVGAEFEFQSAEATTVAEMKKTAQGEVTQQQIEEERKVTAALQKLIEDLTALIQAYGGIQQAASGG